jgi:CRP/FNR family transcriptional regulator, cyclic AMP receptor protein
MTIETFEKTLGSHPFFADLAPHHLATIVGCTANVIFEPGEFIFREGMPTDRFYVLREGKVAVEISASGRGALSIETLEAGEMLGWSWLFPPYTSHFDARAATRVRALSLDGACLRRKCENDATLGYDLVKRFAGVLIKRLEATRIQLLDLYGS